MRLVGLHAKVDSRPAALLLSALQGLLALKHLSCLITLRATWTRGPHACLRFLNPGRLIGQVEGAASSKVAQH